MVKFAKRAVIGGGLLWLWWRHFGPEPRPTFHGVQRRPSRLTGRTVVVGPHEFFVRETGPEDGRPLVLVHGWVYDSLATWYQLLPWLDEGFRVIQVDHRNHGKSDRIRGRYEVEMAADELAGVLHVLGVAHATIVGFSMGGMITQSLARRHPGLVDRMILLATASYPIPHRRWSIWAALALGRGIGIFSPDVGARFSYHYLKRVGAVDAEHARWLWETLLDRDVNLYFEGGRAIWRFDARPWVGTLDVPTLVIIPTEDQLIPAPAQYEMASLLGDAEVIEFVGAKHEIPFTHPEELGKAVNGFASQLCT